MEKVLAALAVAVAFMIGAVSLGTVQRPDHPLVVALFVLSGVFFAVALLLGALEVLARPRLVIGNPRVEARVVVFGNHPRGALSSSAIGAVPTTSFGAGDAILSCAYIFVKNSPRRKGGSDARAVHATVRYRRTDGSLIHEIVGRWSALPQHADPERTLEPPQIDISANGVAHSLDVAMKYVDDEECFAFNDENRFHTNDLRHRPLGEKFVWVEIDARGANARAKKTFALTHSGAGCFLSLM